MSLAVLALMVVVGVTSVVALVHVTGGSSSVRLANKAAVVRHIAASGELGDIDWCVINDAENAAMAMDQEGKLCLAMVTGKHVTVHLIEPGEVTGCRVITDHPGKAVVFRLQGLAWPRITFSVRTASDADRVARELTARMTQRKRLEADK